MDNSDIPKKELRAAVKARVKSMTDAERTEASTRVCDHIREQSIWREAKSVLFYAPILNELDISPLIDEALDDKKIVALPRFEASLQCYRACQVHVPLINLTPGRFQIREPSPNAPILPLAGLEVILVPGVAFDVYGRRLGRGGGFYDRLLAGTTGKKCGVAFAEQMQGEIPVEAHDILLDYIVTPNGWLECIRKRRSNELGG